MLHCALIVMNNVGFLQNVALCGKSKKLHFGHVRPENLFHMFAESPKSHIDFFSGLFYKAQIGDWCHKPVYGFPVNISQLSYGSHQLLQSWHWPLG